MFKAEVFQASVAYIHSVMVTQVKSSSRFSSLYFLCLWNCSWKFQFWKSECLQTNNNPLNRSQEIESIHFVSWIDHAGLLPLRKMFEGEYTPRPIILWVSLLLPSSHLLVPSFPCHLLHHGLSSGQPWLLPREVPRTLTVGSRLVPLRPGSFPSHPSSLPSLSC